MTKHAEEQRRWIRNHPDYTIDYRSRVKNDFYLYFRQKYYRIFARCRTSERYVGKEVMSKNEWLSFIQASRISLEPMFELWKKNGFKRNESPSIDRIDSTKGYVIGNCRWLAQGQNSSLGGKSYSDKGTCRKGHAWVESNIIKRLDGQQECRICRLASKRAWERKGGV